ncbi:MAG: hypothetical protein A2231_07350 [Candidatus Firestonebacteria bacterium RIFOXYA2_FULL_40_8]|nr:MAG: hypothetical protein A2231_07350 [Candidatus Firestonebacteria bacterium RIFOXYA2_FULL_40_8]
MNNLVRIKSGVSGLDEMLNGGFIKGSSVLLSGHSGTGKTMLGFHFIKEGLKLKEKCIYISLVKDPEDVIKYYDVLNVKWSKYIENKDLILISSGISEIDSLASNLEKIFRRNNINRIVIDGLSSAIKTCVLKKLYALLIIMKKKNITSISITTVSDKSINMITDNPSLAELFNSIIVLRQSEKQKETLKSIVILKAEGTSYNTNIKEIEIKEHGVEIKDAGDKENKTAINEPSPVVQLNGNMFYNLKKVEEYLTETFKKKHPEVIIEKQNKNMRSGGSISRMDDLKSYMGIIILNFADIYRFAKEELLVNLDDCIEKDKYFKGCLDACTFEGKIYGIPEDVLCKSLIYRKDLLDKYSIEVPRTWAEIVKAAQYILNKENDPEMAGVLFHDCRNWLSDTFLELLWSNDGDIFDKEGRITILNDKSYESLRFLQEMVCKYKIMPLKQDNRRFLKGKWLFYISKPYAYKEIVEDRLSTENGMRLDPSLKGKLYIAPLPGMKNNCQNYKILDGHAHCLVKNTKDIKSSIAFLKLITKEKTMREMELAGGWTFPSRMKFWRDKDILLQKPYYHQAECILEKYKIPYKDIKNYELLHSLIHKEVGKVISKEKSIRDTLDVLAHEMKLITRRHKEYGRVVERLIVYLKNNFNKKVKLEDISREIKLNPHYIEKIFKIETGVTISEYLISLRIDKAKELLRDIGNNVNDVAYKIGYNDVSYFCKLFKRKTNLTPREYKLQ